jgi:hypothetical protein
MKMGRLGNCCPDQRLQGICSWGGFKSSPETGFCCGSGFFVNPDYRYFSRRYLPAFENIVTKFPISNPLDFIPQTPKIRVY